MRGTVALRQKTKKYLGVTHKIFRIKFVGPNAMLEALLYVIYYEINNIIVTRG
jgi:hypothetical protein